MMKFRSLLVIGLIASAVAITGCAGKKTNPEGGDVTSGTIGGEGGGEPSGLTDSDSGNAMGIQTIHFPYDSFEIVGENRDILKSNIQIMKDNPTVNVQIEGHCDERGGIQYNLALGEKRANAVKQQILAGGVAGSRVTTISMGKERPIASGSGEDAWSKNRRANFSITSK